MAQRVISDLDFPMFPPTKDLLIDAKGAVWFRNFKEGTATPLRAHVDFIRDNYVPFLIRQIDVLGFKDTKATFHLYGFCSATGTAQRNLQLSRARAAAIGQVIKQHFDAQKVISPLAKKMTVELDIHGESNTAAIEDLDTFRKTHPDIPVRTDRAVEALQWDHRVVAVQMQAAHTVVEEDKDYFCQQVYNAKLNTQKVPANLLEQKIDEIQKKLGTLGSGAAGLALGQLKDWVAKKIKTEVEPLLEDFPETAILFETIDFVVPSDLFLCFRFRDGRGTIAQYQYTGSENKKALGFFDAICHLISLVKWLTKVEQALEAVDKLGGQLDKLKDIVKKLKTATGILKKAIEQLLDKDGWVRKHLGDAFADQVLALLQAGTDGPLIIPASGWFKVQFVKPSVYAVNTFFGPAETWTREYMGKAIVDLKFLGKGPEGRLGFQAEAVIHSEFSIEIGLLGYGVSRGTLILMK